MEFSSKYHDSAFPAEYAEKHGASLFRRLNDRREQQLLRQSLADLGELDSIADIGCGPGRFWPVIAGATPRERYALDVSHGMLAYARQRHEGTAAARFHLASGSVMALPFRDDAFDCVVSMRLLHHFGEIDDRRQAMAELARIADRYVVVSLWTDGNYKAWRRQRLEARRGRRDYQNRFIVPERQLAEDFAAGGLRIIDHRDLVPGYSQWRYYVCEVVQ
ncbi:MAG: class I SAM-dependent methyltransferase [Pseudomonadota bacterium]